MEFDRNSTTQTNPLNTRFAILNKVLTCKYKYLLTGLRVLVCFVLAVPLAPLVACSATFIFTSTLISLPFVAVPLCVLSLVAYFVWRFVLYLNSFLLTAKKQLNERRTQPWQDVFNFLPDFIKLSPQNTSNHQLEQPSGDNGGQTCVDNFVSCINLEEHEDEIKKLNVRSILHTSRPRFYSVEEDIPWQSVEMVVPNSKLSGYPDEMHTVTPNVSPPVKSGKRFDNNRKSQPRAESTLLSKNVAIVKNYPNDCPAMLEKLEEMHRLLTNIRRRANNRKPAHVHLRQPR